MLVGAPSAALAPWAHMFRRVHMFGAYVSLGAYSLGAYVSPGAYVWCMCFPECVCLVRVSPRPPRQPCSRLVALTRVLGCVRTAPCTRGPQRALTRACAHVCARSCGRSTTSWLRMKWWLFGTACSPWAKTPGGQRVKRRRASKMACAWLARCVQKETAAKACAGVARHRPCILIMSQAKLAMAPGRHYCMPPRAPCQPGVKQKAPGPA